MNEWLTAAVWMGLALAASLISIRLAISVALVEIIYDAARLEDYLILSDRLDELVAGNV